MHSCKEEGREESALKYFVILTIFNEKSLVNVWWSQKKAVSLHYNNKSGSQRPGVVPGE